MRIIFSVILFACCAVVYSQQPIQVVRGTVRDADSKSPLPGVNVILADSGMFRGVSTDMNGEFRFDGVPVGRRKLKFSMIGYKELMMGNLLLSSGKELVLNVEMEENIIKTREIVVSASSTGEKDKTVNEMATVSSRMFSVDESNKYAGSWGDPARMASRFAGVVQGNDQRNDIIVRGNSPVGVLWKMEGIEIPNPNHFSAAGSTGGGISMLNNNQLDNSDFMSGAFPAEYGNALSSAFDLHMRKGNNEKHEHLGQVGVNGFEFGSEGPFSKNYRGSYLANIRYSSLTLLDKVGMLDWIGSVPNFKDGGINLFFPTHRGNISVFAIGGNSDIVFQAEKDKTARWSEEPWLSEKETSGSTMAVTGISWMHFLSDHTYIKAIVSPSYSKSYYTRDTLNYSFTEFPDWKQDFTEKRLAASILLNKKISGKHTLRSGMIATHYNYDYLMRGYYYNPEQQHFDNLLFDGQTQLYQAYAQWKYKPSEKWLFISGIHNMLLAMKGQNSLEPRMSVKYSISEKQSVSAGYGIHSRMMPAGVYFGEVIDPNDSSKSRPNLSLPFMKSMHGVIGYDRKLWSNMRLKAEAYYQYLYRVPVSANRPDYFSGINAGADFNSIVSSDQLKSTGTGYNYGAEVTLERFLEKGFYFLATGSLYQSKYKGSDNITRNSTFNGNYAYNVLGGKEFKAGKNKNNIFNINVAVAHLGGRRYVPIDLAASNTAGRAVYNYEKAYEDRIKDYFRADLRLSYRLNKLKFSHEIAFEIKNIFNNKNIWVEYYGSRSGKIEKLYQMGFFPVAIYKIEF